MFFGVKYKKAPDHNVILRIMEALKGEGIAASGRRLYGENAKWVVFWLNSNAPEVYDVARAVVGKEGVEKVTERY